MILKRGAPVPRYIQYMVCPPKTVQCGPEKHGAINNREAQKICGAPDSAGPLALAQSAPPPLIRPWQELFEAPAGTTRVAHRLRIMREIADETVNAELVPMLVMRCITHCQKHWPTVMELGDLPLGN